MIGNLVVLWTDALIFMLLVTAISFGIYAAGKPHLRGPWRAVIRNRVGMGTLVVLFFYVAVGLLDSLHFHPQNDAGKGVSSDVISLFDTLVEGLRTRLL